MCHVSLGRAHGELVELHEDSVQYNAFESIAIHMLAVYLNALAYSSVPATLS